jgi:hypothetical protein
MSPTAALGSTPTSIHTVTPNGDIVASYTASV